MAKTVLKIRREGEFYRLTLREEPSYETVAATIAELWPELVSNAPAAGESGAAASAEAVLGSLRGQAKYLDEDGDLCTLTPQTFDDFLTTQRGSGTDSRVLRLEFHPRVAKSEPGLPSSVPEAGDGNAQASCPLGGAGAPPGLSLDEEGTSLKKITGGGFGPKRLMQTVQALRCSGELSGAMLTSLFVQGLPAITQRVARKVDKIDFLAKRNLGATYRALLEALAKACAHTEGLETLARKLEEALAEQPGPSDLGETLLRILKALGLLSFEAKVHVGEALYEKVLPLLEDLAAEVGVDDKEKEAGPLVHPGVTCDACGASPLQGPRFRCEECPDYDLCGNCFPKKQELHKVSGGETHQFHCILKGHCLKGKGKGKGKCGGMGHWLKGLGKGKAAFWAAIAAQQGAGPWAGPHAAAGAEEAAGAEPGHWWRAGKGRHCGWGWPEGGCQ